MPKGRELADDLDRLVAASVLFSRQQAERATLGDEDDYQDAKEESRQVVSEVLDTIEKNLDEDLLENLDRGDYPRLASVYSTWPRLRGWRSMWPTWNYNLYGLWSPLRAVGGRVSTRRTQDMLDEILEDFRADFEDRLKRARREDRAVTDAELDESLQSLKEDLSVVARRARRREDRREEEGPSRRSGRTARESRSA
jgi:hypothetical protein